MLEGRFLFVSDFPDFQSASKIFPDNWLLTISIMNGMIVKGHVSKYQARNFAKTIISSDIYQPFESRDVLAECIRDATDVNFDLSPIGRLRVFGRSEILKQALGRDHAIIGGEHWSLLTRISRSVNMGVEIDPTMPEIVRLATVTSFSRNYRPNPLLLKFFKTKD